MILCLGPGSGCDVCLEPFGNDHKAPCSIDCGHVFCLDCLNHISRASCPLCRIPFELGNHVKLHVDLDANNTTKGSPPPTTTDAATLQEGRRLQEAIASLANQGTSEAGLCQLIADCRSFLSARSRQEFQELRVSYRMVSYIYEIKSRLRDKEHALEPLQASVDSLQSEKAELSDKLLKSETQRKDDKERAFQVEMSLRHHCEQTQASYNELVKMYQQAVARIDKLQSVSNPVHHVPEEWEHRQHLKNFPPVVHVKASPDCSSCDSLSPVDQGFLISPLPEFTSSTLPVHTFSPLPDDDTCNDSKLQPHCLLDSLTPFPDTSDSLLDSVRPSPAFGTSSPSLLTMTAPRRVETRTSRSQSFPTASRPNSRPPTCPSSPAPARPTILGPTLASSTADLSGSNSVGIGIPAPRDPDRLRTRLRDLLDTNIPSMSSSLPNLNPSPHVHSSSPAAGAAYLSRGDSRHTPQSRGSPPPPSRSEALSYSNPSLNPAGATNATPLSAGLTSPTVLQNPSAPRAMMSHASTAAQQALERVQKEERNKDREQRSRMAELPQPPAPPPLTPMSTKPSVDGRPPLQRSSTQMYIQTTAPLPVGADRSSRVSPTKEREWTSSTPRDRETAPVLPIKQSTMTSASSASSVPRESSQQRHHHHPHHHPSSTGSIGSSKGKLISSTIPPMYA